MKKPNFIELRLPLPGRKSTIVPAVKKYFNRLVGKEIGINFGRVRERKIFKYRVERIDEHYYLPQYLEIELGVKVPTPGEK